MQSNEKQSKVILVVDDEENIRDTVRIHLEREGYRVAISKDGENAIEVLKKNDISLIITDIKMPRLNGFGLLDYSKEHHPSVPVIMLTGYIDVDIAVDAMREGTFHYLTKPIGKSELIAVVEEALKTSEHESGFGSFRVSQVYLLAEAGTVILHKNISAPSRLDSDIFGSMLTAVRMFISDSFGREGDKATSFEYGSSKILIEEGAGFFLVVIGEAKNTSSMREKMKKTIKGIEMRYGDTICSELGNTQMPVGIEREIGRLLEWKNPSTGISYQLTQRSHGKPKRRIENRK